MKSGHFRPMKNRQTKPVLTAVISGCTFYGNSSGIGCSGCSPILENTIIAFSTEGGSVTCTGSPSSPALTCCDVYGNAGGDWVGCIADQFAVNGNISEDPLFCDAENGDLHLDCSSPCVYGYGCGQMGACGIGCGGPSRIQPATWGSIKAIYR